jgi:hypothetical protein
MRRRRRRCGSTKFKHSQTSLRTQGFSVMFIRTPPYFI